MQYLLTPLGPDTQHFAIVSRRLNEASNQVTRATQVNNTVHTKSVMAELYNFRYTSDPNVLANYKGRNVMVTSDILTQIILDKQHLTELEKTQNNNRILFGRDDVYDNIGRSIQNFFSSLERRKYILEGHTLQNLIKDTKREEYNWLSKHHPEWFNHTVFMASIYWRDVTAPAKDSLAVFMLSKNLVDENDIGDIFEDLRQKYRKNKALKELFDTFVEIYTKKAIAKGIQVRPLNYKIRLTYLDGDCINEAFSKN